MEHDSYQLEADVATYFLARLVRWWQRLFIRRKASNRRYAQRLSKLYRRSFPGQAK
jgi:hypothetical protein